MYEFLPGMVFGVVIPLLGCRCTGGGLGSRLHLRRNHCGHAAHTETSSMYSVRRFNMAVLTSIQLELTLDDIKWAIVRAKKLKIKPEVR